MPVKNNNRADRGANRKAGNAPKLSAEEERKLLAKQLKLTKRQVDFINELVDNKGISATEAYMRIYKPGSRKAASVGATRTLANDSVRIYQDAAVSKAKKRIVQLVDSDNESIALKAAQDIIDREKGKAVQKNETTQNTVVVKLDHTGLRIGAHYLRPEQRTVES